MGPRGKRILLFCHVCNDYSSYNGTVMSNHLCQCFPCDNIHNNVNQEEIENETLEIENENETSREEHNSQYSHHDNVEEINDNNNNSDSSINSSETYNTRDSLLDDPWKDPDVCDPWKPTDCDELSLQTDDYYDDIDADDIHIDDRGEETYPDNAQDVSTDSLLHLYRRQKENSMLESDISNTMKYSIELLAILQNSNVSDPLYDKIVKWLSQCSDLYALTNLPTRGTVMKKLGKRYMMEELYPENIECTLPSINLPIRIPVHSFVNSLFSLLNKFNICKRTNSISYY